jgi:DNA-binding SARP family transcriptional activator
MTPESSPPPGSLVDPARQDARLLELLVLGPPVLRRGDQEVHFRTRKAFGLLVYLALTRLPHSREQLASLLWPDHEAVAARTLLRTTLSQLRNHLAAAGGVAVEALTLLHTERDALGREVVGIVRDGIPSLLMDVELMEVATSWADDAGEAADSEELLQQATEAYRGPFLTGVAFDDAPELDGWVGTQRVYWQDQVEGILEPLSTLQLGRRAFTEATATGRRWLGLNRFSEPAYKVVMRSLGSVGDRAGALAERARPEAQVLFYDDVQWADLATRDLLLYRLPRQQEAGTPHLLLLTVRSEALASTPELESWLGTQARQVPTTRLHLGPLAEAEIEQAIATVLADPTMANGALGFGAWLYAQTEGQPFYLTETLRTLVDRRILVQKEGVAGTGQIPRFALGPGVDRLPRFVPGTVRELIRGQLSRRLPLGVPFAR